MQQSTSSNKLPPTLKACSRNGAIFLQHPNSNLNQNLNLDTSVIIENTIGTDAARRYLLPLIATSVIPGSKDFQYLRFQNSDEMYLTGFNLSVSILVSKQLKSDWITLVFASLSNRLVFVKILSISLI